MPAFQFPDPTVTTTVVNPNTGELWRYADGVWMLDRTYQSDEDVTDANTIALSAEIQNLRSEVEDLRLDIISLRAVITNAQLNDFLILD